MRDNQYRAGFTALELLVAIAIVATLVALLSPALSNARRSARIAEVKTDIGAIESALTDFKAKFGEYPPSRITLHKTLDGWNSDPRSKTIIRRLWPQFDFTSDGSGGTAQWEDAVELDGSECLLFFLAGVRDPLDDQTYIGFSNNPSRPFSPEPRISRVGPFLDHLLSDRVMDDGDGDPFYVYLDPLNGQNAPYVYLSSYDGRGYDNKDLGKRMSDFYRQGSKGWKAQSFQIISPGFDGQHGPGGLFDAETADMALTNSDHNKDGEITPDERRQPERDNITNFHRGTLAD